MSENQYFEYLKDKNVILVGPAEYLVGQSKGEEINKYDVIVRMNSSIPVPDKYKEDYGNRTDVLYHRLASQGFPTEQTIRSWRSDGVKWIVVKMQTDHKKINRLKGLIKNHKVSWLTAQKTVDELKKKIDRAPNQGIITIVHLLSYPIKSLTVMGIDFYATGYFRGYNNLVNDSEREKMRIKNRQGRIHNMASQVKYLRELWETDERFVIDDTLKEVLISPSVLQEFEKILKNKNKIKRIN